jgi:hypothetical protein
VEESSGAVRSGRSTGPDFYMMPFFKYEGRRGLFPGYQTWYVRADEKALFSGYWRGRVLLSGLVIPIKVHGEGPSSLGDGTEGG